MVIIGCNVGNGEDKLNKKNLFTRGGKVVETLIGRTTRCSSRDRRWWRACKTSHERRNQYKDSRNWSRGIPLPVEGIIRVTLLTEGTAESVGDVGTGHLALLIDFGNVDLDRSVILGDDQSVGGRALAGDVKVDNLSLIVLHDVLA